MAFPRSQKQIVLVEDDPNDQRILKQALGERGLAHALIVLDNGDELLAYLQQRTGGHNTAPTYYPDLILLDLDLPGRSGLEVLAELKTHPGWRVIPVVALTRTRADEDVSQCYDCGANAFIAKPATYQEMLRIVQVLELFWFQLVQLPSRTVEVGRN